ncbi:MAG: sigma-70 family RNA polymerase sigma factor [Planctomycetota bacterium]|jgi:RNA polymerase sigma factor (TIGR02999 family)
MTDKNTEQPETRRDTVTRLLEQVQNEDPKHAHELLPLVYDELRALARAHMAREGAGNTIQATVLVHEAFIRLVGDLDPGWNGRGHFFGAAAVAMRRILVETARRKGRQKRGGDWKRIDLDDACAAIEPPREDVLAVERAVRQLEAKDPRKGQIVNLRYFAGFTAKETGQAMNISLGTIEREWRFIKAWLRESMEQTEDDGAG